MFIRQYRLLIQVKELAESGQPPTEIAKTLKIHTFVSGKLHQQNKNFSLEQLEQIYDHLLDIDVGVKTGRTDMVTALDLLIAGLAGT
jgi:DNA polymerase-3 subunit delta